MEQIKHLPWWAQILIGIGMLALAGGMHEADKKVDSDWLDLGAFLMGIGGFIVLLNALYGK